MLNRVFRGFRFDWQAFAVSAAMLLFLSSSIHTADDPVKRLLKQAAQLRRAGLIDDAEAKLREAVATAPNAIEPKTELAYVLVKQRRVRDAYDLCLPVAEANPRNPRVLAVLGATMLAAGRFADARSLFYTALQINRREHLAWAGYGMLDFYENKIFESIDNLREATYYDPSEPDYVFALAQVAARAEQYKEAAASYRKFLSISKNTDTDRRERIKGLVDFLDFLGHVPALYANGGKSQTNVPFELEGNRPVVNVRLNKKGPELRFVLDTGSGISVLSEETAQRLNIKPVAKGGYARGLGGDGKFAIVYGHLKQLNIGDVQIRDVPVYIRRFHSDGPPVDGYIGLALISKFLATIDYGSKTFSLTKRDSDRAAFNADQSISLPLRLTSSGFLSGEVELEGVDSRLNFIVDTGASVSVISDVVSKTGLISQHAGGEKLRVIGSAGITEDVPTYMLPRVTFGNQSAERVKAIALNLDLINEASGFEQAGILGGNFLKDYRLTFDFRNSKVIFVPIRPEKE